jgi:hypothetical protein
MNHPEAPGPERAEGDDAPTRARTIRAPDASERLDDPRPARVECARCGREIPGDEAVVAEAQDLLLYFCSPGCYAGWREAGGEPSARAHASGRDA